MKVALHQSCIRSVSDCNSVQSSAEFTARKILISRANNRYLKGLITLQ
jgi:hypothetical protein